MKKILIMALSLCMVTCVAKAEEKNDTTIIVSKPNQITINQSENTLSVKVNGNEENPNYLYSTSLSCGEDAVTITEEKSNDFNFNVPFVKSRSNKRNNCNIDISGFGFGLVNAVNSADGMNVDMGASYEFMINNLFTWDYRPWKGGTLLSIGFGFDWKNYRMKGKTQFIKQDNNVTLGTYPEGSDIKFSRIKVFSLTVPFTLTQQLNRDLKISVGPVVNFNTHASLKTRYKLEGKKIKLTDNNIHQTPVTVDFMGSIGFKNVGLYIKYSPSNVLDTEYGPKFSSLSTGMMLFF